MNNRNRLSEWTDTIRTHFGHLSLAQVTVLAMWSFGMVLAQSCGTTSVAYLLANILQQSKNTVRQRLREGYLEITHKRGRKRKEVDVTTCFVPLIKWILSWWTPDEQRLVLV